MGCLQCFVSSVIYDIFFCDCMLIVGNQVMRQSSRSCLSNHCDLMCTLAFSTLENFFESICSGSITLGEIVNIKKKKIKVKDLYSACFSATDEKTVKMKSDFNKKLDQCFAQAHYFQYHKALLSLFCDHLYRGRIQAGGKEL